MFVVSWSLWRANSWSAPPMRRFRKGTYHTKLRTPVQPLSFWCSPRRNLAWYLEHRSSLNMFLSVSAGNPYKLDKNGRWSISKSSLRRVSPRTRRLLSLWSAAPLSLREVVLIRSGEVPQRVLNCAICFWPPVVIGSSERGTKRRWSRVSDDVDLYIMRWGLNFARK